MLGGVRIVTDVDDNMRLLQVERRGKIGKGTWVERKKNNNIGCISIVNITKCERNT